MQDVFFLIVNCRLYTPRAMSSEPGVGATRDSESRKCNTILIHGALRG